jgi:hypothetical protein
MQGDVRSRSAVAGLLKGSLPTPAYPLAARVAPWTRIVNRWAQVLTPLGVESIGVAVVRGSRGSRGWTPDVKEGKERDTNGVEYYEVVRPEEPGKPLILIASRHPVDNYPSTGACHPRVEDVKLVNYFEDNEDDWMYDLTLDQAHEVARSFGADLITAEELNPGRRPEWRLDD